jgi:hypothetical protein
LFISPSSADNCSSAALVERFPEKLLTSPLEITRELDYDKKLWYAYFDWLILRTKTLCLVRREAEAKATETFRPPAPVPPTTPSLPPKPKVITRKSDGQFMFACGKGEKLLEIGHIEACRPNDAGHHRNDLIKIAHLGKFASVALMCSMKPIVGDSRCIDYPIYLVQTRGE